MATQTPPGDNTNNPHIYSTLNQIEEYVPVGGTWVRKLNRVQLPNGHFMLDPQNPNYWRDFDKFPCSYKVWEDSKGNCNNPGDTYRDKLTGIHEREIKAIPEPEILPMLLTGIMGWIAYQLARLLSVNPFMAWVLRLRL